MLETVIMPCKKILFPVILFIFITANVHALTFDMISPGSEGDNESAAPILQEFYDYLKVQTGESWEGSYHNDEGDALKVLKRKSSDLAVINPLFHDRHAKHFALPSMLKTIPIYANEPHEKYYIMSGPKVSGLNASTIIFASATQEHLDLETLFPAQSLLKNKKAIPTNNLLKEISAMATGTSRNMILLSGYEHSVIEKLKTSNKSFQNLKLQATSLPQPSAHVVVINPDIPQASLEKLKAALLKMNTDPEGQKILQKLRLKGFSN